MDNLSPENKSIDRDLSETLKKINSIDNIENGKISEQMFFNLAYGQWILKEMESGEAWNFISKELIK